MKRKLFFAVATAGLLLGGTVALAAAADGLGPWADDYSDVLLGLKKDGGALAVDRTDPGEALGVAETTGTPYDAVTPGTFLSLGFGGTATFEFDNTIINGDGDDLMIYEVTGGNNYPDEEVKIEASSNGSDWVVLSNASTRDASVDLGELQCAKYVRLTDVSNPDLFNNSADGYDVDGLEALNSSEETECGGEVYMCEGEPDEDEAGSDKLLVNRWRLDENGEWEQGTGKKGNANDKIFSLEDTHGCGCDDILETLEEKTGGSFEGHWKFGCSQSILEDWISGWYPLESLEVSPYNSVAEYPDPVSTSHTLFSSEEYKLIASGVWSRVGGNMFDAQYSAKNPSFVWGENGDPDNGDLRVNDVGDLWGVLDAVGHMYELSYSPGSDENTEFYIWMNDVNKYPDNLNEPLTVDILLKLY